MSVFWLIVVTCLVLAWLDIKAKTRITRLGSMIEVRKLGIAAKNYQRALIEVRHILDHFNSIKYMNTSNSKHSICILSEKLSKEKMSKGISDMSNCGWCQGVKLRNSG